MENIENTQSAKTDNEISLNRTYKDSVFRLLFKDKDNLISLYNAISGTNYSVETPLEFTTIEEAVFRTAKNDLAFLLQNVFVVLIEHQSSVNKNMAVRDLIYYVTMIQRMFDLRAFYQETVVEIPKPEFIVLYNGTREMPDYYEIKLTDNFSDKEKESGLQLTVKVYNINKGKNPEIMERCKVLKEYSQFVDIVREYAEKTVLSDDVMREVLNKCRAEDVLKDFLEKYGTEVVGMLFEVLTEEEDREISRKDGLLEGEKEGKLKARFEIAKKLKDKGFDCDAISEITGLSEQEAKSV